MGQWGFDKNYNAAQGGTMPATLQQVIAAMYTNSAAGPLLNGGAISGRGDRSYAYSAGVGVITTAAGAAMITWAAGVTSLVGQPSTDRVDVIWANEGGVFVSQGGAGVPANACILDRRRLPAGATQTSASVSVHDKNFALPYGAQLGRLFGLHENKGHLTTPVQGDWHDAAVGEVWVPTDRLVTIVTQSAVASKDQPADQMGFGSMGFAVRIDGQAFRELEIGFDKRWVAGERSLHHVFLSQGRHTIQWRRRHLWGAQPWHFGGTSFEGSYFAVIDSGVAQ